MSLTPEQAKALISNIGLDEKVIEVVCKNKKLVAKLGSIVEMAGGKADKTQGNLLYTLSTKLPPTQDPWVKSFVDSIMNGKWNRVMQVDEAIDFLKLKLIQHGDTYVINQDEFDLATGVGINVTDE